MIKHQVDQFVLRKPLPANGMGNIYENQASSKKRYFELHHEEEVD
jgi:hypothetical protein